MESAATLQDGQENQQNIFHGDGHTASGDDVVELPLNVRGKAREGHIVSGIENNLYRLKWLVKEGYVPILSTTIQNI